MQIANQEATGQPWFTWKMAVKVACVCTGCFYHVFSCSSNVLVLFSTVLPSSLLFACYLYSVSSYGSKTLTFGSLQFYRNCCSSGGLE